MKKVFSTEKLNCALYGFIFGSIFPFIGTIVQTEITYQTLSFKSIILVHMNTPLLWIIDTAPFWLSLFAMFGGIQLDKINAYNKTLEHEVEEKVDALNDEIQKEKKLIIENADAYLELEAVRIRAKSSLEEVNK